MKHTVADTHYPVNYPVGKQLLMFQLAPLTKSTSEWIASARTVYDQWQPTRPAKIIRSN